MFPRQEVMPIPVTTTRRSAMWRDVEVAKVRVWETEVISLVVVIVETALCEWCKCCGVDFK